MPYLPGGMRHGLEELLRRLCRGHSPDTGTTPGSTAGVDAASLEFVWRFARFGDVKWIRDCFPACYALRNPSRLALPDPSRLGPAALKPSPHIARLNTSSYKA